MKHIRNSLFCAAWGAACMQAMAACYTVYDPAGRVIWQGPEAPVDMSLPLHEAVARRFPGGSMMFDSTTDCSALVTTLRRAPATAASPLLTDQGTARAMNVPFTALPGGMALVRPSDARMQPKVTVIPAQNSAVRSDTVITEMRNPPATIVQRDGVVVGDLGR